MASYEYLNCSNQVRNSCPVRTRRGYSKAQMCFFKILHVISSIPPSQKSKLEPCPSPGDDDDDRLGSFPSNHKGIGIDLNLRFCSAAESGESESFAENESDTSAIERNNGGGEAEAEAEAEALREKSVEVWEATDTQVQSSKVDNNGVDREELQSEEQIIVEESEQDRKGNEAGGGGVVETVPFAGKRNEGCDQCNCLDLLIEAAELVSAKDESNSEEASGELRSGRASEEVEEGGVKKRIRRWMVADSCSDAEETPPVVRSKRGRNQALPYRFRDSVVEPLKRSGRPRRPSSTPKRLIGP